MSGLLKQEWLRLRTLRSTWVLSGLSLAVTLLAATALTLTAASRAAAGPAGRLPGASPLGSQRDFASVLASTTQLTPLLMGLLGVLAFGHEYRYGIIRLTLTTVPGRTSVAAARLLGVALWATAVGIVCVAASGLVLAVLGRGRFAPGVGVGVAPTGRIIVGAVLYIVLFALVGLALGSLLRNVPAAISLLFVLPLLAEPIVLGLLSIPALDRFAGAGRFLPFHAGQQLTAFDTAVQRGVPAGFQTDLSPLAGGLTFALVTAALLAVALVLFRRRDA